VGSWTVQGIKKTPIGRMTASIIGGEDRQDAVNVLCEVQKNRTAGGGGARGCERERA